MRAAAVAVLFLFLLLAGCGYVGPVVPPSPELPNAITNLAVAERGPDLVITFATPPRTTDNLAIKRFSDIDLRIGPTVTPFDFNRWALSAKRYDVPLPPANDPDDPTPHSITREIPASEWVGKRIAVLVRTAVKRNGHDSQWSNRVVLEVVPPLDPPVVQAKATKEGYLLTWAAENTDAHYTIFRQGPNDKTPAQIGTSDASPYLDSTSQWDTPYSYTVVAQKDSAESLPSKPFRVTHADTFPPAIPASITAVAGPDSIELSWSRSPDADLKGYFVYRSTDGGTFERQGDLLTLPSFSDRAVQHGHVYHYAVTAVDQKNNESDRSTAAEIAF